MPGRPYTPTTRVDGQTPVDTWWNDLQTVVDQIDSDLAVVEGTGVGADNMFGTYFEPVPFHSISGYSAMSANTLYGVKFRVARAFTVTSIKVDIGTLGTGNIDGNIYTESGGTWTRMVAASTPISTGSTGLKTITLAASAALVPGTNYWMCIAIDNATAQPLRHQCAANARIPTDGNDYINKSASYPLPSTFSTPGINQNFIWGRCVGTFT